MIQLNLTIPVVTLNENGLNASNKGRDYHIGLNQINKQKNKKQGPAAFCPQETNFKYNDSHK